mmetsp:Transcript_11109/g.24472  ORF Transcript_11109/g.24472 Transcript_11109/m.24472 type:complete len:92 (+) Transcript_11109:57-332(+)
MHSSTIGSYRIYSVCLFEKSTKAPCVLLMKIEPAQVVDRGCRGLPCDGRQPSLLVSVFGGYALFNNRQLSYLLCLSIREKYKSTMRSSHED